MNCDGYSVKFQLLGFALLYELLEIEAFRA